MLTFQGKHLLLFLFLQGSYCQRRIKDGSAIIDPPKRYMVQLRKARESQKSYTGWLCGGALVSTEHIVTSAACVMDVDHLYAIAGYSKYVREGMENGDECIRTKRKKIVSICIHASYKMEFQEPDIWSDVDIAVVKVESPYDFNDEGYGRVCSYTPNSILINFDVKYTQPGVDAFVLGWGHEKQYREDMDDTDYNRENLYYAQVLIQDKEECKKEYEGYHDMDEVIEDYMICTNLEGNVDAIKGTVLKTDAKVQGCGPGLEKLQGEYILAVRKPVCVLFTLDEFYFGRPTWNPSKVDRFLFSCQGRPGSVSEDDIILVEHSRKNLNLTNYSSNADHHMNFANNEIKKNDIDSNVKPNSSIVNKMDKNNILKTRKQQGKPLRHPGICQNDHGGPLVTWIGAHEYLIGVASAYKVSETRECIGPYLYTSTQCSGIFLDCAINGGKKYRREICDDLLNKKGMKLIDKTISWKDHADGPADNERNITTPAKKETMENDQEYNFTKFDDSNITNTNVSSTINLENTNLTTKQGNIGNATIPTNLINTSANTKESKSKMLTSVTNLNNGKFTNFTNDTPTKFLTNVSITNFEPTTTTILMKNANKSLDDTVGLTKALITSIELTPDIMTLKNATKYSIIMTSINNASVRHNKITATTISMKNATNNLFNATRVTNETINNNKGTKNKI